MITAASSSTVSQLHRRRGGYRASDGLTRGSVGMGWAHKYRIAASSPSSPRAWRQAEDGHLVLLVSLPLHRQAACDLGIVAKCGSHWLHWCFQCPGFRRRRHAARLCYQISQRRDICCDSHHQCGLSGVRTRDVILDRRGKEVRCERPLREAFTVHWMDDGTSRCSAKVKLLSQLRYC